MRDCFVPIFEPGQPLYYVGQRLLYLWNMVDLTDVYMKIKFYDQTEMAAGYNLSIDCTFVSWAYEQPVVIFKATVSACTICLFIYKIGSLLVDRFGHGVQHDPKVCSERSVSE